MVAFFVVNNVLGYDHYNFLIETKRKQQNKKLHNCGTQQLIFSVPNIVAEHFDNIDILTFQQQFLLFLLLLHFFPCFRQRAETKRKPPI